MGWVSILVEDFIRPREPSNLPRPAGEALSSRFFWGGFKNGIKFLNHFLKEIFAYTPLRFVGFVNRPCLFILISFVSPKSVTFHLPKVFRVK